MIKPKVCCSSFYNHTQSNVFLGLQALNDLIELAITGGGSVITFLAMRMAYDAHLQIPWELRERMAIVIGKATHFLQLPPHSPQDMLGRIRAVVDLVFSTSMDITFTEPLNAESDGRFYQASEEFANAMMKIVQDLDEFLAGHFSESQHSTVKSLVTGFKGLHCLQI